MQEYGMSCIEQGVSRLHHSMGFIVPLKKQAEAVPHPILPANERGTRMDRLFNPGDAARWLALADVALSRGASAEEVAETEALARKEQTAIKRNIQRRSQLVYRQSKSKQ
jgi:hypothetical protein